MKTGAAPKPQIVDLDRDGLLDIVVGTRNQFIHFFRNKGTRTAPDFNPEANSKKLGGVDMRELGDPASYIAPQFVDFQGKWTLFCGSSSGRIWIFLERAVRLRLPQREPQPLVRCFPSFGVNNSCYTLQYSRQMRMSSGSSFLAEIEIDHPGKSEFVVKHSKKGVPRCFGKRHRYLSTG